MIMSMLTIPAQLFEGMSVILEVLLIKNFDNLLALSMFGWRMLVLLKLRLLGID